MPALEILDLATRPEADGHATPFTKSNGVARSHYWEPDGFGQFVVDSHLAAGTVLDWLPGHGDEIVYVLEGEIAVDGASIGPRGAVVIESDAATRLEATAATHIVHLGTTHPGPLTESTIGPPSPVNHGLHVTPEDAARLRSITLAPLEYNGKVYDDTVHTAWFADATCDTCRAVFFRVWGDGPHNSGTTHSHSIPELMVVTGGAIQVGDERVTAGMVLAIPADLRYTFSTIEPWEFLNYRPDASWVTRNPAEPPIFDQI
jgi:hypothetical protein